MDSQELPSAVSHAMPDENDGSRVLVSSASSQTCPVCLEIKDVLVCDGSPTSCRHGLCKACANRLLLGTKPAPSSLSSVTQGFVLANDDDNDDFNYYDMMEQESLLQQCAPAIPTLGQCPICRGVLNLFELKEFSTAEKTEQEGASSYAPQSLSAVPAFAKDPNVSNWPIAGCSFELNSMGLGKGSLHFPTPPAGGDVMPTDGTNTTTDLAQTSAYLNFEGLSQSNTLHSASIPSSAYTGKWKRDDESNPPARLYFEPDSQHFHHQSRTFHGSVRWNKDKAGATLNHAATWQMILQFSSDLRYVSSGAILARPLSSVDRNTVSNDTASLDGIWRISWWSGEAATNEKKEAFLQVTDGEFHMSSNDISFHLHHQVDKDSAYNGKWSLVPDSHVECQYMADSWTMIDYRPSETTLAETKTSTDTSTAGKETNAPPMNFVPVGSTLVWGLSSKEQSEKPRQKMELCRLGLKPHFMDGVWKVTWTSSSASSSSSSEQNGVNHSATIAVMRGRWSLNGMTIVMDLTTNPFEPRFDGPPGFDAVRRHDKERDTFRALHVNLATQTDDPAVGLEIAWTADGTAADPQMKWTLESTLCTPSTRVELLSPRYAMSFRRIHDDAEAAAQLQYHRDALWGNVFAQRMSVGLASYHFISPTGIDEAGAYISYESPLCSVWPPLDDGSPVPSRVPFSNMEWDAATRTFRGRIEWYQRYGCSWQGSTAWRYEMVFDTEFTCIVGGQVWTTVEGVAEEQEMSQYGRELIYFNATIVDHFQDLIEARLQGQGSGEEQRNDAGNGTGDQAARQGGQIEALAMDVDSRVVQNDGSADTENGGSESFTTTPRGSRTSNAADAEVVRDERAPTAGDEGVARLAVDEGSSELTGSDVMEFVGSRLPATPELQMAEALQNIAARVRRLEGRVEAVTPLANRIRAAATRSTTQEQPRIPSLVRRRSRNSETYDDADEQAEARARRTTIAAEVARSLSSRVEEEGASDRLVRHFRAVLASTVRRSSSRSSFDDAY